MAPGPIGLDIPTVGTTPAKLQNMSKISRLDYFYPYLPLKKHFPSKSPPALEQC
jgi:hypothetical protein